jgi:hypothetical protein
MFERTPGVGGGQAVTRRSRITWLINRVSFGIDFCREMFLSPNNQLESLDPLSNFKALF